MKREREREAPSAFTASVAEFDTTFKWLWQHETVDLKAFSNYTKSHCLLLLRMRQMRHKFIILQERGNKLCDWIPQFLSLIWAPQRSLKEKAHVMIKIRSEGREGRKKANFRRRRRWSPFPLQIEAVPYLRSLTHPPASISLFSAPGWGRKLPKRFAVYVLYQWANCHSPVSKLRRSKQVSG